ncbi:MAG: type II CAAX endopeptidase family protein [Ramlibacter sp.]
MNALLAFETSPDVPKWRRRLLCSPLARMLICVLLMAAIGIPLQIVLRLAGWIGPGVTRQVGIASALLVYVLPPLGAYLMLTRYVEKRWPAELLRRRLLQDLTFGLVAGAAYISTVVAALWLAGAYEIAQVHRDIPFAGSLLVTGIGAAVFEEILFRGVLFRIVEEGLGTWAALLTSALIFGFVHIGNPGATVWSSLAIAIEAGLLLGMTYQATRSLPLCIGLHAAWNFTQGSVYGSAVSGTTGRNSWLVPRINGPEWLTGGAFGFEASVVAAGMGLVAALALIARATRRGTLVPWRPGRARAWLAMAPEHGLTVRSTSTC